jgi:mitogen-activated protein kinase kinase kinase
MLNNVLQGDVLKSEKTRINTSLVHQGEDQTSIKKWLHHNIWLRVRSFVRNRDVEQEQRYLEEVRAHIPPILEEVKLFKVKSDVEQRDANESRDPLSVEAQVGNLLRKIEWCESLYPSTKALGLDHPLYAEPDVSASLDALRSWQSITKRLEVQIGIIQKWTGSTDLEVTQPNEGLDNEESPLNTSSSLGSPDEEGNLSLSMVNGLKKVRQLIDTSSFLDRILKEGGLQEVFNKKTLLNLNDLVKSAKETMIANSHYFATMNLPTGFTDNLVALVNFPPTLMQEALRLRLESVKSLKDPPMILIDQLTDDFRTGLILACKTKRQFLEIAQPDPTTGWGLAVQPEAKSDFDRVLVDSLRFFFKLLNWKLKNPNKAIAFKETEIVESEWMFLSGVSEEIVNGDLLVGQHFRFVFHSQMIIHVLTNP